MRPKCRAGLEPIENILKIIESEKQAHEFDARSLMELANRILDLAIGMMDSELEGRVPREDPVEADGRPLHG